MAAVSWVVDAHIACSVVLAAGSVAPRYSAIGEHEALAAADFAPGKAVEADVGHLGAHSSAVATDKVAEVVAVVYQVVYVYWC